jgi:TPP-dependent pyruvate/acetoin dehydrogenase alpha subunit
VDPIQLLASRLLGEGVVSQAELDVIDLTAKAKAAAYIAAARDQPDVTEADIGLEDVYP